MILLLCLACLSLLASGARAVTPYAEESDIVRQSGVVTPGELQWHRAGDNTPYLTIGTMEGGREAIRDRAALHRSIFTEIKPPAYSIALGDGVTVSNGFFVLWADEITQGELQTREITITPAAGFEIVAVTVDNLRSDAPRVDVADGIARIFSTQNISVPGFDAHTDCAFAISQVLAVDSLSSASRDDLTMGDYLFIDELGPISLGGLRKWADRQHSGNMGADWSRWPATNDVSIAGRRVFWDAARAFRCETEAGEDGAALVTYAGARRAVELRISGGDASEALRIMDFSAEGGEVALAVTVVGSNHVITASETLDDGGVWADLPTESSSPETVVAGGAECYVLRATVPAGWTSAFFRVRASVGGAPSTTLAVRVPLAALGGVILESPGGVRWRLVVDDAGNLSTVPDF